MCSSQRKLFTQCQNRAQALINDTSIAQEQPGRGRGIAIRRIQTGRSGVARTALYAPWSWLMQIKAWPMQPCIANKYHMLHFCKVDFTRDGMQSQVLADACSRRHKSVRLHVCITGMPAAGTQHHQCLYEG
jgi:hypothetical protein